MVISKPNPAVITIAITAEAPINVMVFNIDVLMFTKSLRLRYVSNSTYLPQIL